MKRRHLLFIGIALVLTAASLLLTKQLRQQQLHSQWHQDVQAVLRDIESRPPSNINPQQWAHAVSWTLNLHANCASDRAQVDQDWELHFLQLLRERTQNDIRPDVIDWIWDEYALHTQCGRLYFDKYRSRFIVACE